MAKQMTDPMNALISFQKVFKKLITKRCELFSEYIVHPESLNGIFRISYAKIQSGKVQVIAIFASTDPLDGHPCYSLGYAVNEKCRGRGLAVEAVEVGIKEMKHGFGSRGFGSFYIEAVIDVNNSPSIKVAEKIFSSVGKSITDSISGLPALSYKRLVKIP